VPELKFGPTYGSLRPELKFGPTYGSLRARTEVRAYVLSVRLMDEKTRRKKGEATRRQVLGDAHVDRSAAQATAFVREFQDLLTRYAWGEIWTRPGLDARTRRVLVIGTLVALGRRDELRLHARAALEDGALSAADLKEILLQQAIYCGIPAANAAFEDVREVVEGLVAPPARRAARPARRRPGRRRP
jgi:4-carboxymuconolactone decarboxylase